MAWRTCKHAIMPLMRIAVCFDGRISFRDHVRTFHLERSVYQYYIVPSLFLFTHRHTLVPPNPLPFLPLPHPTKREKPLWYVFSNSNCRVWHIYLSVCQMWFKSSKYCFQKCDFGANKCCEIETLLSS